MGTTRDRRFAIRSLTVCAVLAGLAGIAGCGGTNAYSYAAPAAVAVADFAGTGHPGVAIAQAQINQLVTTEQPGYAAIILQNPNSPGTFGSARHFETQGNPSALAVGALTTGTLDLAVTNVNDGTVSVLLQSSPQSTSFGPAVNLPIAPSGTGTVSPQDVAICDVNQDGHPDIVVGYVAETTILGILSPTGGGVSLLLQSATSPGTFVDPTIVGTSPTGTGETYPNAVYGIACANLSSDSGGPPDIVMASYYAYDGTNDYGTLSIFFHDPNNLGGFLPRVDIPLAGLLHRVVIADLGNGLPDILVSSESTDDNGDGISGVQVLMNQGPGVNGEPTFAITPYPTYSALSVAVGDIHNNGLLDIVVASSEPEGTGSIEILPNTVGNAGTFGTATVYPGLGNPTDVATGELGNNSLVDIATSDGGGAAVMSNEASSVGSFGAALLIGS
ncbi:MAG: VCBS repeat-containing protein [Steroidobacteraceae bacterium]